MATKIVGVGVKGTVAGLVVTFDRPISGDGLTVFVTGNFLLNLSTGTSFDITAITRDASDKNKITSVTLSSTAGWSTGDFFALLTDNGTTTFLTIPAAVGVASAGDEVIVYPRTNFGDRYVRIVGTTTVPIDITIETDTIGERNIIASFHTGAAFTLSSPCTVRDFYIITPQGNAVIRINNTTGLVIVERCILVGGVGTSMAVDSSGDARIKNTIALFGDNDAFATSNAFSGTVNFENCEAFYFDRRGFNRNVGGTVICTNCVSFQSVGTPYFGVTGDNNVSDTASIPTGTGNLINQTLDQVRPAFDFITGQPTDWRFLDGGNSVLEDGGKVIAGLVLDIDGRTRDGTTPNIGPTEDFTQFGTPTIGRQIRARHHNV